MERETAESIRTDNTHRPFFEISKEEFNNRRVYAHDGVRVDLNSFQYFQEAAEADADTFIYPSVVTNEINDNVRTYLCWVSLFLCK